MDRRPSTHRPTEEMEVPVLAPLKFKKIANKKAFPMEDLLNLAVLQRQMEGLQLSLESKAVAFCNKTKNETLLQSESSPGPQFLASPQPSTTLSTSYRVIRCSIKKPLLRQCGDIALPSREVQCEVIKDVNNIDSIYIMMEGYHYSISPELVIKMKAFIRKGDPLRIIGERVGCQTAFLLVNKFGVLALPVAEVAPGLLSSRCSCRDPFVTKSQLNVLEKSCQDDKELQPRLRVHKKLITNFCQPVDPTWGPSFWSSPRTGKWTAFYEPALYSNRLYGFNKLVHKQKFDVAALKAKAVNIVRCDKRFAHTAEVCGRAFRSIKCARFSDIDFKSSTPIFNWNERNFQALKPFPPVAPDKAAQTDVIAYFDGDVPHFWAITDDSLKRIKTAELTLETQLNNTDYSMASLGSQKPLSAETNSPVFAINSFLKVAERNAEIRKTFKVLLDEAEDYCNKTDEYVPIFMLQGTSGEGFSVPLQKFEDVLESAQGKLAFVECAIPHVSPGPCYGVVPQLLNFRCRSLTRPATYDQAIVKVNHQLYRLPRSTMAAMTQFLDEDEDLQIVGDLRGCQASLRAVARHRIQELVAVELILSPHQYNCRCSNPTAAESDLKAHEKRCKDIYASQTPEKQNQALDVVRDQRKFVRSHCRPAELVGDKVYSQDPGNNLPFLFDLAMDQDRFVEKKDCQNYRLELVENQDKPLRVQLCSSSPTKVRMVCEEAYSSFQCGPVSQLLIDNKFEWNRVIYAITDNPKDMSQEEIEDSDIVLYDGACGPRFFATGEYYLRPLRAIQLSFEEDTDVQFIRRPFGNSSIKLNAATKPKNEGSSNLTLDQIKNSSLQKVKSDKVPSELGSASSGSRRPRRQLTFSVDWQRPSKSKAKVLQERQPYIETQANDFGRDAWISNSTPMVNQTSHGDYDVSAFEVAQSTSLAPASLANPIVFSLIAVFCLVRKAFSQESCVT